MTNEIIERHIPCEVCGSSDAKCIYADGHGYCFSCSHYFPVEKDFEDLSHTFEYLPWRGVSKETMAFYDVKTKINSRGQPVSIGFRYPDNSHKVRLLDSKEFYSVGTVTPGLFGADKFTPGAQRYVTITEGELDALSLNQALGQGLGSPVVSVHSSVSAARDVGQARSWLNEYERIYLAFDGDAPGREAAANVAKLFDYDKVFLVKFDQRRKDANDYLQNGELEALRKLWWNAKPYQPDIIKSSFEDFTKILSEKTPAGVPYPFPKLTEMTYGMRTGESVLITAQEGVGKTEIMHALEYQLLTETDDNVGCIFLEEPQKRHLQLLAGVRLKRPAHLPDSGCTDDDVDNVVRAIVGRDDRLHLYNHFGSADPDVLTDHIRFLVTARQCRWILLDHISMAFSSHSETDERRAIDRFCTGIEMLVVQLGFGFIFVSHVNDLDQTRSSRWPAKVAHVRIHATRDVNSGSNVIDLTIKDKNRLSGRTGPAGSYAFDQYTRMYTPVEQQIGEAA